MRTAALVSTRSTLSALALALAACGSTAKPATGTGPAAAPGGGTAADAYCEGYAGCADEDVRMSDFEGKSDDEMSPDERKSLAEAVQGRIVSCRETFAALAPHQQAWVESCTGCGGSCDVYDCLDQGNSIAEGVTFECDIGDEPLDEMEPDEPGVE